MAGEVHPVPFRTRKLSPLAPMVLRSSPWESRTSLTNEGHLRAEGPVTRVVAGPSFCMGGPGRAGQALGDIGEHEWSCGFKCGCGRAFVSQAVFSVFGCALAFCHDSLRSNALEDLKWPAGMLEGSGCRN